MNRQLLLKSYGEDKAVAICRLKRVAADHRDDIVDRLPKKSEKTNGKKVALLGAGCASLAVANDLLPMGYEVTIFEALDTTGGLMRTNIPQFRLPPKVLDEEINYILDMGADLKLNHRIESMKDLLDNGGFDAIFVGKDRAYNRRFQQMCGHYLVDPVACTPASGWEKGQVENQVGVVRRRFFVPRPKFKSYAELNAWLEDRCVASAKANPHQELRDRTI